MQWATFANRHSVGRCGEGQRLLLVQQIDQSIYLWIEGVDSCVDVTHKLNGTYGAAL